MFFPFDCLHLFLSSAAQYHAGGLSHPNEEAAAEMSLPSSPETLTALMLSLPLVYKAICLRGIMRMLLQGSLSSLSSGGMALFFAISVTGI